MTITAFAVTGCDIGGGSSGGSSNNTSAYSDGSGDSDQNGGGDQGGETITNAQEPTITAVNLADAIYTLNATADDLSIAASVEDDGDLTFQWYKSGSDDTNDATAIEGETDATYKPSTANAGTLYYFVVVTNTNNNATGETTATATSDIAQIVVNEPQTNEQAPSIQTNPLDATYSLNEEAEALSVTASSPDGGTLTYQWYKSGSDDTNDATAIEGATSATYTPSTASVGTLYYYVVVSNSGGSVTSDRAQIVVNNLINAKAPIIDKQPVNATYTRGASSSALKVVARSQDEGELSYQWYKNGQNNTIDGTLIEGATSNQYSPSTENAVTLYYFVKVTNTKGGVSGAQTATLISDTAKIVVSEPLIDAQQPTIDDGNMRDATYTQGYEADALSVDASVEDGGELSYEWYQNTVDATNSGIKVGDNSNSYTPSTANAVTLYYFVKIINANDNATGEKTATVISKTARIVVNEPIDAQEPTINAQPIGKSYTQGDEADELIVEAISPDDGTLSYQWYKYSQSVTADEAEAIDGATSATYTPSTESVGAFYYFVKITNDNTSLTGKTTATATSQPALIVVNAPEISGYAVKCYNADLTRVAAITIEEGSIVPSDICGAGTWYLAGASAPTTAYTLESAVNFYGAAGVVEITDQAGLEAIATTAGAKYILMNDIALVAGTANFDSEQGWLGKTGFKGVFNGDGHKISGLWVNRPNLGVGLFRTVTSGGKIKNLGVEIDGEIIGGQYVGGIAGQLNNGEIINSYVSGGAVKGAQVNGTNWATYVGAIVGHVDGGSSTKYAAITNNYSINTVVEATTTDSSTYAGGIAGYITRGVTISNCYSAETTVRATGDKAYVGGIAGAMTVMPVPAADAIGNAAINQTIYNDGASASYNSVTGSAVRSGVKTCELTSTNFALDSINMGNAAGTASSASSCAGTSKTIDALKAQSTYEVGLGWSFGSDESAPWRIDESGVINNGYPYFYWRAD